MSKYYFVPILLTLFASTNCAAADYLLRIETAELRGLPNGAQEPDLKTRETVEILVHAGKAFYVNTKNGTDRVQVTGKLEEANDGTQRLQVNYRKTSASGETVPGADGQRFPISNGIAVKTDAISVKLGKSIEFDISVSSSKKVRAILSVNNFDTSRSPD